MSFIIEDDVEKAALEILKELGYEYSYGPDIAPDSENPLRKDWDEVVLKDRLLSALTRINKGLSQAVLEEAAKKLLRLQSNDSKVNNEKFHDYLINGLEIESRDKDRIKGLRVKIIDFENPKNNDFLAMNQFTIIENKKNRRPDILLFINGLPIGLIELKNPANKEATIRGAFDQVQTYLSEIPSLFNYNELVILADGTEAKVGTFTSSWEWFMPWRTIDGKKREPLSTPQLEILLKGLCNKEVLIDFVQNFIGFQKTKKSTIKVMAGYHQYHATNKAIKKTYEAVKGNKKIGVVWHTQGSGKSLTMAFYVGKITRDPLLKNPSIVVITDRNDLDDQLFTNFTSTNDLFRESPQTIDSQMDLKKMLKVSSGGIFFTTIQKFLEKHSEKFELLSNRDNIIVVADEAHRTQYGLKGKLSKENMLRFGFAKYLRDALPNASFLGFTGTPIELSDKSTRTIFGDYIDIYDMNAAIEDKRVVRIYYDPKLIPLGKNEEVFKELDESLDEITEFDENNKEYLKSKWSRIEALVGSEARINKIAETIVKDFELRQSIIEGKALIVCMSRRICVELHDAIKKIRPEWYNKDDSKGKLKVIMTGSAMDGKEWQEHIRTKVKRREMAELFKDSSSDFKIAIVRDMWLTGFDVPSLSTMYLDKPIRHHNLMQAIARVNRVYKEKQGGIIVDFIGIAEELRKAVTVYSESGGEGKPSYDIKEAVKVMLNKYEVIQNLLHGYEYSGFFKASSKDKMRIIPEMMDFILKQDKGKERFVNQTTALLKALSLAATTQEAINVRSDAALFQAISNAFQKTDIQETSKNLTDTAIKQLVSKAISAEGVIDIYKQLGMKKQEISILSDKFLNEFQAMEYKNLAFEALKKLLNDEIKARFKTNKIKNKKFSEMLEEAIKKYQNRSIDSAQVIEELIKIAKEVREAQKRGEQLGLSEEEISFYDALANNESAIKILGEDILKKMAVELTSLIKNKTTVDWNIRDAVRANIRVTIKKLLKKYGYPPDKTEMATDLVLKQAELSAQEITNNNLYFDESKYQNTKDETLKYN